MRTGEAAEQFTQRHRSQFNEVGKVYIIALIPGTKYKEISELRDGHVTKTKEEQSH